MKQNITQAAVAALQLLDFNAGVESLDWMKSHILASQRRNKTAPPKKTHKRVQRAAAKKRAVVKQRGRDRC